jgi:hypothetical protein
MMVKPARIGVDELTEKNLYLLELPEIAKWPAKLHVETPHFGLFLAIDARGTGDEEILGVARTIAQRVGSIVSEGFSSYAWMFHPAYRWTEGRRVAPVDDDVLSR